MHNFFRLHTTFLIPFKVGFLFNTTMVLLFYLQVANANVHTFFLPFCVNELNWMNFVLVVATQYKCKEKSKENK